MPPGRHEGSSRRIRFHGFDPYRSRYVNRKKQKAKLSTPQAIMSDEAESLPEGHLSVSLTSNRVDATGHLGQKQLRIQDRKPDDSNDNLSQASVVTHNEHLRDRTMENSSMMNEAGYLLRASGRAKRPRAEEGEVTSPKRLKMPLEAKRDKRPPGSNLQKLLQRFRKNYQVRRIRARPFLNGTAAPLFPVSEIAQDAPGRGTLAIGTMTTPDTLTICAPQRFQSSAASMTSPTSSPPTNASAVDVERRCSTSAAVLSEGSRVEGLVTLNLLPSSPTLGSSKPFEMPTPLSIKTDRIEVQQLTRSQDGDGQSERALVIYSGRRISHISDNSLNASSTARQNTTGGSCNVSLSREPASSLSIDHVAMVNSEEEQTFSQLVHPSALSQHLEEEASEQQAHSTFHQNFPQIEKRSTREGDRGDSNHQDIDLSTSRALIETADQVMEFSEMSELCDLRESELESLFPSWDGIVRDQVAELHESDKERDSGGETDKDGGESLPWIGITNITGSPVFQQYDGEIDTGPQGNSNGEHNWQSAYPSWNGVAINALASDDELMDTASNFSSGESSSDEQVKFDSDHEVKAEHVVGRGILGSAIYKRLKRYPDEPCKKQHIAKVMEAIEHHQSRPSFPISSRRRKPKRSRVFNIARETQVIRLHNDVREFARSLLGTEPWAVPSEAELDIYKDSRDIRYGPRAKPFLLDLAHTGLSSPWNKRAAEIFTQEYLKAAAYECTDARAIEDAFTTHLITLQHNYKSQVERSLRAVTPALQIERQDKKKQLAHDQRRRGLYTRRFESFKSYASKDSLLATLTDQFWKYCTPDVMSGDETDHSYVPRKKEKRFIILVSEWRNPDVVEFFRVLDALYMSTRFTEDGRITAGRFPAQRVSSHRIRKVKFVTGLPSNFYNPRWLATLSRNEVDKLEMRNPVPLNFTPEILRIAARFIHIENRLSIPLPRSHPAVTGILGPGPYVPTLPRRDGETTELLNLPSSQSLAAQNRTPKEESHIRRKSQSAGSSHQERRISQRLHRNGRK